MNDHDKTKAQLSAELHALRQRVAALEGVDAERGHAEEALKKTHDDLERKIAERTAELTKANEELAIFRRFAEASGQGFSMADLDGCIAYINPALCRILGEERAEEAVGKNLSTYFSQESRRRGEEEILPALQQEGHWEGELPMLSRHGRSVPTWHNAFLIRDESGNPLRIAVAISDITERKQAEEALRVSEERFRSYFEQGLIGMAVVSLDRRWREVNDRLCKMLGYSREELAEMTWMQVTHPDDVEPNLALSKRLFAGEITHYNMEKRFIRKDGNLVYASLFTRCFRRKDGTIDHVVALVEDVTERTQAETALRESEERYKTLVETSPDAVIMTDLEGRATFASQRALELYGGERIEELLGRPATDFIVPEDHDTFRSMLQRNLQEGTLRDVEYTLVRKDGTRFPAEVSVAVIKDTSEKPMAFSALLRDITERKQAAEALRASEERFRVAFEEAPVGMVIGVGDGTIAKVNRAICQMTGYTPEELTGRHVQEFTHPDDRHLSVPLVKKLLAGEIPSFSLEKRYLAKGGRVFYAQATTAAVCNPDGSPAFALGIIEDITDRKRAEEALRQSHDELQAIYDGMVDGLLIVDIDTQQYVRANDSICRMLGYSKEELLTMFVPDTHPPEQVRSSIQAIQAQVEGRIHVNSDVPMLRKDGTVFYADVAGRGLAYAGRRCAIGFFRDTTERKHAEEALRQSYDELQAIYDQVTDGIIVVDAETGHPVRSNSAYCRMLGYDEEEVRSLSPERVHPPDVLPSVSKHLAIVQQGIVARIQDLLFLRSDGSILYADVVSSPIRYNKRPCWISFFHDVTARKRAEESLQREHRTLKHMLQSSDHERQLIAYEIHDGLAQQLAAAIMQFDTFSHLKDKQPKDAARAFEAGVTMLRQGHFEARRLISGVRPPVLDESGVVEAIAHLVHEESRRKEPQIESHCKVRFDRLVPILENAIYRIVQESLTNACNHSQSKNVRIRLLQHGNHVRIEIRDWGVGFDPQAVPKHRFGLAGIRERAQTARR